MTLEPPLPKHSVRESRRAKHVHLRFSLRAGLEVVVPPGFDRSEIPALLRRKARWIDRAGRELEQQRRLLDPTPPDRLPATIELRALGESWIVIATPSEARRAIVREADGLRLEISGPVHSPELWRSALKRWLARKARLALTDRVATEAAAHDLRACTISIRWQKSRWGSCSRRSAEAGRRPAPALSLNAALLFLPPHLVRYVLLHELCHTEHMNHSLAFWRRLEGIEPAARALRDELRSAWHFAPAWADGMSTSHSDATSDSIDAARASL